MRMEVVTNSNSHRHRASINIKHDVIQVCTHIHASARDSPQWQSCPSVTPSTTNPSCMWDFWRTKCPPPPRSTSAFPWKYYCSDTLYSHSITSHRRYRRQLTASINKTHLARYTHTHDSISPGCDTPKFPAVSLPQCLIWDPTKY